MCRLPVHLRLLLWLIIVAAVPPVQADTPPLNDNFTNRFNLTGIPVLAQGSNVSATREPYDPLTIGADWLYSTVWWSWTAPSNGQYVVATFMTNDVRPLVMAYTGSPSTGLVPVFYGQQDPAQVIRNGVTCNVYQVTFNATAGTEYEIIAGGRGGYEDSFELVISPAPSIRFETPSCGADFTPGTNILLEAAASVSCGTVQSVQYSVRWFGPVIGVATNPPWSVVWSNVAVGRYELVAKVTDSLGITALSEPLTVTAGRPANDDFANRIDLSGLPVVAQAPVWAASKEVGEPFAIGTFTSSKTVWWSWTAPSNGLYAAVASVTNRSAVVGVYYGTNVSGLLLQSFSGFVHHASITDQTRNYSQANWQAIGGTTYQIVIDGGSSEPNDTSGPYEVSLAITQPPRGEFVSPANGSVFANGAAILLQANPLDEDGIIKRVAFYQVTIRPNSIWMDLLAATSAPPWGVICTTAPTGCYPVCASVTDDLGAQYRLTNTIWVGVDRPLNDDFAAATRISNTRTNITIFGSNYWATSEPGEPYPAMKTVWWAWTAPASGQLGITATGSSFLVCTGSSVSTMVPLISGSLGAVGELRVEAGTTYHISLGEMGYGNFTLNLSTPPAPAVQLITLPWLSQGVPRFLFSGVPGQISVLEGSIDLRSWVPLVTNININGPMAIMDPSTPGMPRRFYRLRQE